MLWKFCPYRTVLFCFLRARLWIPLLLPSCYGGLKPWAKWIFSPLNCYHPIVIIQLTNAPCLHLGKYSLHSTHSAPLGLSAFFPVRTPMDATILMLLPLLFAPPLRSSPFRTAVPRNPQSQSSLILIKINLLHVFFGERSTKEIFA